MEYKIDKQLVRLLQDAGLRWEDYLILYGKSQIEPVWNVIIDSLVTNKEECLRRLKRRKFLDDQETVTKKTIDLFGGTYIKSTQELKSKSQLIKEEFDKFWNSYPTSDKWGNFPRTRTLRQDKKRAYKYYLRSVKEFSPEEILSALDEDIKIKKGNSTIENRMMYMPQICTWLNKRHYEGIIEDLKDQKDLKDNENQSRYGEAME